MLSGNECTRTKCVNNKLQIKLSVVGDGYVGKMSVIMINKTNEFFEKPLPTAFEHHHSEIDVNDKWYSTCVWDTSGTEFYERLRLLSFFEKKCFLLCFAINNRRSFKNITDTWYPELQKICQEVPVILVGTKSDLRENDTDCISKADALLMKKKIKAVKYLECSALKYQNVDQLFEEAVRVVIQQTYLIHNCCLNIKSPFSI